jgi:hypothetical protein
LEAPQGVVAHQVTISLNQQEVTRTVELRPNTKESAVRKQLGY